MTSLADVFVQGRIDTSKFGPDIKSGMSSSTVKSATQDSGKTVGGHFKTGFGAALRGIAGPLTAALGAVAVGSFFKSTIDEAREAQKVSARTAGVIKSTGGAAQITAGQIGDLATAISNKTAIDDEAIQSGANLLLTFKNIRNETGKGNDIFSQATQTITDLSAGMDQGLKASAVQLGKALNDPVKGISALSRVGVTFDDVQKKQIERFVKQGDTMKAQKIILAELNSEFGGAAASQATAGEKAQVAFDNLKESIGTALLPYLDKLFTYLTTKIIPSLYDFAGFIQSDVIPVVADFVDSVKDAAEEFRANFGDEIEDILGTVKGAFEDFLDVAETIFNFLNQHREIVVAFAATVGVLAIGIGAVTAATTLWTAALALNPIGIVVVALAALVAGLVYAYKNSETFANIVNKAFETVKTVVADVVEFATAAWEMFGSTIVSIAKQYLGGVVQLVKGYFQVISGVFELFRDILSGNWSELWGDLGKIVQGAWEVIKGFVKVGLAALSAPFRIAWAGLQGIVIDTFHAIGETVTGGLDRLWQAVRDAFADIVDLALGFAETLLGLADKAFGWIPGLGGKLDDAKDAFRGFRDDVNAYLRGIDDQHVTVTGSFSVPSQAQITKVTTQLGGLIPAATGGLFTGGMPGKDSIHALVMPGEYIAKTKTVAREGVGNFHLLNQGKASIVPHFADGGLVLGASADASGAQVTASIANRIMSRIAALVGAGLSRSLDGIVGDLGPPGGAVAGDFGAKSGIGRGLSWMRGQLGKPYLWGGVGPGGYDCSGLMSALTNVIRGASNPYYRLGATSSMPWPGFLPGPGNFSVGWTTNYGGSGIGHTAGTLGGLNVESAGGIGVRQGSSARGAFDGGFTGLMHLAGFDFGGLARGAGWMPKGPAPERVLSPRQTVAFERWMDGGGESHGPQRFVLDVPGIGMLTGYIRNAVDSGVQANNARRQAQVFAR